MKGKYILPSIQDQKVKTDYETDINQIKELHFPAPLGMIVGEDDYYRMELLGIDLTGVYTLRSYNDKFKTTLND